MTQPKMDPEIVREFLDEFGDLLDRLGREVSRIGVDGGDRATVDAAFRAVHTIKGAASFLGLVQVVALAHAMERPLTALRDLPGSASPGVVSLLRKSVDRLDRQLACLRRGAAPEDADARLIEDLAMCVIAGPIVQSPVDTSVGNAGQRTDASGQGCWIERPLRLRQHESEIYESLIADLGSTIRVLRTSAEELDACGDQAARLGAIESHCAGIVHCAEFLGCDAMASAASELATECAGATTRDREPAGRIRRVREAIHLLEEMADGLRRHVEIVPVPSRPAPGSIDATDIGRGKPGSDDLPALDPSRSRARALLRVEEERLDLLDRLVNELVGLAGEFDREHGLRVGPGAGRASGDSDRLTARLASLSAQVRLAARRARSRRLDLLWRRFAGSLDALARGAGKRVDVTLEGGSIEVDARIFEALAHALPHLLRNSIDHGIETPEHRRRLGKPGSGRVEITAAVRGRMLCVNVRDDGRGVDRHRIASRCVEQGLLDRDELDAMDDQSIDSLVLTPGLSTASRTTDLSGRGVGMDAVRESIELAGGQVRVESSPGAGTAICCTFPAAGTVVPCLLAVLHGAVLAIPLENVAEVRDAPGPGSSSADLSGTPQTRTDNIEALDLAEVLGIDRNVRFTPSRVVLLEHSGQALAVAVGLIVGRDDVIVDSGGSAMLTPRVGSDAGRSGEGIGLVLDVEQVFQHVARRRAAA